MSAIHETRLKLRGELEAPPALRRFGTGWISGVLGFLLGTAGLLMVIAMLAPGILAMPETRELQNNPWFRVGLHALLIAAFFLSALSLALRPGKILGTTGMAVTLLAALLGGSHAAAVVAGPKPLFFGLDWFVLNVLLTGLLFIPIESIFPRKSDQPIFREEWREDLFYYLVSSLMVQVLTFLTFAPAKSILAFAPLTNTRQWIGALPFVVQFPAIMFLTDLVQYWVHRAFHRLPWLWKFHAVHHSAKTMDWMAGARMHFLEIFVLRSMTVIPMYVLGFTDTAMHAYIFLIYLYSTFVHANLGWRFPIVEKLLVTPRFHHWHHGIEAEAIDVNFSIHFPLLDKCSGPIICRLKNGRPATASPATLFRKVIWNNSSSHFVARRRNPRARHRMRLNSFACSEYLQEKHRTDDQDSPAGTRFYFPSRQRFRLVNVGG